MFLSMLLHWFQVGIARDELLVKCARIALSFSLSLKDDRFQESASEALEG